MSPPVPQQVLTVSDSPSTPKRVRLTWPPRALGLGPPLNLVTLSREQRAGFGRRALESIALAIAGALVVAAIDQVFFGGETARRTPALNLHPTPVARVAITFIGGFLEELFFRVFFATAVASVVWLALRRPVGQPAVPVAQWAGIIAAAIYVGVWHTTMGDAPSNNARVIAVNAVSNLLYGWTYWRRGLELSALTHGVLNATLYLGLPFLH